MPEQVGFLRILHVGWAENPPIVRDLADTRILEFLVGIWGSGGFPLDWERPGDSFRRSFSPNSGFGTQFGPMFMKLNVLGYP